MSRTFSIGFGTRIGSRQFNANWWLDAEEVDGRVQGYATERVSAHTYAVIMEQDGTMAWREDSRAVPKKVQKALFKMMRRS